MKQYNKAALIAVDVQNDFCHGGALRVKNGDEVVQPLNALHQWVNEQNGLTIVTRDWHPENTKHFDKWPVHCVAGTYGAQFHPLLNIDNSVIISKGTGAEDDGYSGFEGLTHDGRNIKELLPTQGRTALIIGGLATDFCVKATVMDAIKLAGVEVYVPIDAVRAVNTKNGEKVLKELAECHVIVCDSKDIVDGGLIKVISARRQP